MGLAIVAAVFAMAMLTLSVVRALARIEAKLDAVLAQRGSKEPPIDVTPRGGRSTSDR